ncbi:MAG: aldose epimerase [Spirosoma sp.]|nr:aldose epimerase [Spirosoma sp.]
MTTIENDQLRVSIRPQGAELTGIFYKPANTEHLWQADSAVWGWHAPNLFPIVGGLLNDQLHVNGQTYPMKRHGFARQSLFTESETSDSHAVFSLRSSDETRAVYPYEFEFQIIYQLLGTTLSVTYQILNEGQDTMYFSVGAHPAFNVPFGPGEAGDYVLEFEQEETLVTHQLSDAGLFSGETRSVPIANRQLTLTEHLFDQDALVFKNLKSRTVTLKRTGQDERGVTVSFPDFPHLGIWAKPGAPFVCIEPWLGYADAEGKTVPIDQKEAIQHVGAGNTFAVTFTITIH